MTPSDDMIRNSEASRLDKMGIPCKHIMVIDGEPVAVVDKDAMDVIVNRRNDGRLFQGRFVSNNGDHWTGSYISDGQHHFRTGLTEMKAYRYVLGQDVGRKKQSSRYKGYVPMYRRRRHKHHLGRISEDQ